MCPAEKVTDMVHGTEVYKTLFQTIGVKAVVSATIQLIILEI